MVCHISHPVSGDGLRVLKADPVGKPALRLGVLAVF
jgi:hypothetical protein